MNEQRAAFIAILETERAARSLSWREVAREAGVNPGTLHRLLHGRTVYSDAIFALYAWLDGLEPIKPQSELLADMYADYLRTAPGPAIIYGIEVPRCDEYLNGSWPSCEASES